MTTRRAVPALLAALGAAAACGPEPGRTVEVTVPAGASFANVVDTLRARGVVGSRLPFVVYARLRGDDRRIKAGRYVFETGSPWRETLERLTRGEVLTEPVTFPEGFRLDQMAPRIASITGTATDSVLAVLRSPEIAERLGVPGPGAEGYLFPDTYRFAQGVPVEWVLSTMAARYRAVWTETRRSALDSIGLTERELVTLASIIEAEARDPREMPSISSVYHNRLRSGWLLQADPTVLYALGGPRPRLLFAAIDSVADSPYNTYTQPGLPPGPIGAPGEAAIDAALHPADEDFMYFVARPDGTHVFTRTLAEHNRAVAEARSARDATGPGAPGSTP